MTIQADKTAQSKAAEQTELAPNTSSKTGQPRVIVVGAGFGGLNVIQQLANKDEVEVLVLDRNNYHGFWPLLYQVATAALAPDSIAFPVREITYKYPNIKFEMAAVSKVDLENKQVVTDAGTNLSYDYLVLAAGSANNYFGNKVIPEHTFSLKDVDQAVEIRQHILDVLEQAVQETDEKRRKNLLTFAIVGSGPTGVELSGAFADLLRPLLHKLYPTLLEAEVRIVLIEAHDTMLKAFPKSLQKKAQQHLERMHVEVLTNSEVTGVEKGIVTFKNGHSLEAGTVVWAAGVKASELGESLSVKLAHSDRVPVKPTLNLSDRPEVFVVGDMAYLEGYKQTKSGKPEAYPMVAEVAMQMGRRAAHNILADVHKQPLESFRYTDLGTMSTIGRKDAVAVAFGLQLSGWLAWLSWLVVHLFFLIGFRNRVLVMLSWAYDYITYNRGVRLIGGRRPDKPAIF